MRELGIVSVINALQIAMARSEFIEMMKDKQKEAVAFVNTE